MNDIKEINLQEIEEKLRNSFKGVKKDILELKTKLEDIDNLNSNLSALKDQIDELKELYDKQSKKTTGLDKEISDINKKYKSLNDTSTIKKDNKRLKKNLYILNNNFNLNRKLNENQFDKLRNDIQRVNKKEFLTDVVDNLEKLKRVQSKHIRKTLSLNRELEELRKSFIGRDKFLEIESKLNKNLIAKNALEKLDRDISSLKGELKLSRKVNSGFEELRQDIQRLKFSKTNKGKLTKTNDADETKGFLRKKFEEVVDILAEDED